MTSTNRSRIFPSLVVSLSLAAMGCGAQPQSDAVTAESIRIAKVPATKTARRVCDVAVRCELGYSAVDTDGDGCNDACEPIACDVAVRCELGYSEVDTDGDGCNDACEPVVCDTAIRCELGYTAVDTDGDGCDDTCKP